jgi:putative oxidoreductase
MNYKLEDLGLLFFRVSVSFSLAFGHGLGKFQKFISGNEIKFMSFLDMGETFSFFLAMAAEFFCSLLIAAGLLTRINSIFIIATMAVAAFVAHADDPFARKEKAFLYLASYILLFFTGPGRYSLQRLINKNFEKLSRFQRFILG